MEHMKRMLVIAVAVILAGAGLMYVHRHMYKNCSDNVAVQSIQNKIDFEKQKYQQSNQ